MTNITIIVFRNGVRRWEHELAARLESLGYPVSFEPTGDAPPPTRFFELVIGLEERVRGLSSASLLPLAKNRSSAVPDLIIDLTGRAGRVGSGQAPVLTIEIDGERHIPHGLARLRCGAGLVDVVAKLDGVPVAAARPMVSDRVWLSSDCTEVLTAIQSLIVGSLARFTAGKLSEIQPPSLTRQAGFFPLAYLSRLLSGVARRTLRKLRKDFRPFYWQTAYRRIDGAGVAETLRIDGSDFNVLASDHERFYADPFLIEEEGRLYLFVEDFPYALDRGVISVAEMTPDGTFERPRPVLQEPHHLSYPNVFRHRDAVYMIPESGSAGKVILYRADPFPDRWVRDTVLIDGGNFNDATLLERDGRLWMFGTGQFGAGNASDTLMLYSAPDLRGPWEPHRLNPILIDRAGARPGGKVIDRDGRLFLPVQDGTRFYGGGLGLREIIRLDMDDVLLGPVMSVSPGPAWTGRGGIHTLNRVGAIEVIDSAG